MISTKQLIGRFTAGALFALSAGVLVKSPIQQTDNNLRILAVLLVFYAGWILKSNFPDHDFFGRRKR